MEYARVLRAEGRKKEASAIEARVQKDALRHSEDNLIETKVHIKDLAGPAAQ